MEKTLKAISIIVENKISEVKLTYEKEMLEMQKTILKYKNQLQKEREEAKKTIERLEQCHIKELKKATSISWIDNGKYYNLSDFCRVSKYIFFIKETELKQWLFQQGHLIQINDKYIPTDSGVCKLHDNELYIDYNFIRGTIILLRSFIYVGETEDIQTFFETYQDNKPTIIEQMANTVYVECKQRSQEFREHRENKYFIDGREENVLK